MQHVAKEFKSYAWKFGRVPLIFSVIILGGFLAVRNAKVGAQSGQQAREESPRPGVTRTRLAPGSATYGPTPSCTYDFSPVTDLIQRYVEGVPLQGASLLIIKDNQVVYEQAFGIYTLDTRVPIASASKWPSASVIMSLIDDGTLSLDDRVSTYLPDFTGEKADITVRQLFSHTSGLPGDDVGCLGIQSITLAQCVDQIARAPLIAPPGTAFAYGGNSMHVAGRVAEVATGESWDELFQERIAGPLGLQSSDYASRSTAPGYVRVTNPRIAGGMRSTLGDYGRFVLMHVNNGAFGSNQVLSAAVVAESQKDQTFGAPVVNSPHPTAIGYGLGQWRDAVDAEGHAVQLSSQGAFGFSPWIDKRRNLAAVFLVRNELRNVYGMVSQMQGMIRDIVDSAPCRSNAAPVVVITAPADGATLTAPADITVTADASDSDGTIDKVEFYSGETLLHTATGGPYHFAWGGVAPGTYTLTAVATDDRGATATSGAVTVTVRPAPAGGTLSDQTIDSGGVTRYYKKYVPAGLPDEGAPLVFVLHGGGGRGAAALVAPGQPFYRWRELADRDKFIVIYPQGIDANWNDCRSDAPRRTGAADDVNFVDDLITTAFADHKVDLRRVYVTGASNGGMMSYRLAFELSHRIAAVGAVVANLPIDPRGECHGPPARPLTVVIMNGDADPLMPWEGGYVAAELLGARGGTVRSAEATRDYWVDFLGARARPRVTHFPDINKDDESVVVRQTYGGGRGRTEVVFFRVKGGGHTMPSVAHPRAEPQGNQNEDVEGADYIWEAFKTSRRNMPDDHEKRD